MSKTMTDDQIREWEKKQKNGVFSYILEQALIFTPLFLLPRPFIYYFLGETPFGIGMLFEWLFVSFCTAFGVFAVSWYQQQRVYKKALEQKLKKNQESNFYGEKQK